MSTSFFYWFGACYKTRSAPGTIEDMANVQSTDFVHDRNGNLVTMEKTQEFVTSGPKGSEFMVEGLWLAYNAENMPTEISRYTPDTGTTVTTFAYDAGGRRVIKREEGGVTGESNTFYLSDAFEVKDESGIYYYDKYIFAGILRVAQVRTTLSGYEQLTYIHKDHLGSTTVVTDEYGDVPIRQPELTQYRPYGGARAGSALNTITDYNFTDQEWDGSTGLYNYDARLYSPEIALFVTADILIKNAYDPQLLNRYAYTRDNPIKYIDPSGHEGLEVSWGIGHVWGIGVDYSKGEFTLTLREGIGTVDNKPLFQIPIRFSYDWSDRESTGHNWSLGVYGVVGYEYGPLELGLGGDLKAVNAFSESSHSVLEGAATLADVNAPGLETTTKAGIKAVGSDLEPFFEKPHHKETTSLGLGGEASAGIKFEMTIDMDALQEDMEYLMDNLIDWIIED